MSAPSPKNVLAGLLRAAGHPDATAGAIELPGTAPALPSSFAVDAAAQATIAAAALAANELWRLRTGRRQGVSVDMRSAAIEFRSERYLRIDGKPPSEYHDPIAGLYRCGDGRWVRLHTNLPHHRDGVLALLGCSHDRAAVQRALDQWRGEALETAAADAGLVVTACRSFAEWDAHPQGRAIARLPPFTIDQIGDAPARPMGAADRPLAGVKVLDLTRTIAGPVCGRTLAAHGADVLLITASHLPSMQPLVIDTGRGKLSTSIDLRRSSGRETLAALLRGADVFVQGYRPGAIAAFGFGPPRRRHDRNAAALGPADGSTRHACARVAVVGRFTSVDPAAFDPRADIGPRWPALSALMAIAGGYGGGCRESSRESPGKSEPGCKPVIRLVASLPRAAAIADGGPVSSESRYWGPQGRRWFPHRFCCARTR